MVNQFVFSLFLKRDDDESDEDVDEEERKHDEADDVEQRHFHSMIRLRTAVDRCRVHRVHQNTGVVVVNT